MRDYFHPLSGCCASDQCTILAQLAGFGETITGTRRIIRPLPAGQVFIQSSALRACMKSAWPRRVDPVEAGQGGYVPAVLGGRYGE